MEHVTVAIESVQGLLKVAVIGAADQDEYQAYYSVIIAYKEYEMPAVDG